MANELKVIVYQDSDFRWAERISSKSKKRYRQNLTTRMVCREKNKPKNFELYKA